MNVVPIRTEAGFSLNAEQTRAAENGVDSDGRPAGPLLIIAGAGTGKTLTLAHRVANLVAAGVDPRQILLLTFTRQAAREMTRRAVRIARQTTKPASGDLHFPWAGTFHSVANRILRRYAPNLGLDPQFSVLDRGDAADLIDFLRHEQGLSKRGRRFPGKDTCLQIYSRRVNSQEPLDVCLRESFPWCVDWQLELTSLFRAYVEKKQSQQLLDYDDLLLYWFYLTQNETLAAEIGGVFRHVLVDEFQDTNLLQAGILSAMKPDGRGLTVVGDDAQSIYSFRAARVENILRFPDQFVPGAKIVSLEKNYRSSMAILETANQIINASEQQFRKTLYSDDTGGQKPYYVQLEDTEAEADYVASEILIARETGLALKQQAVLFRNSHHSDQLELELLRRNIPYVKFGGLKFLEAAHVKDILAVLKWADNKLNQLAALRVLKLMPGFGPQSAERCFEYLAANDHQFSALSAFRAPAAAGPHWAGLCATLQNLSRDENRSDALWHDDLQLVREWYQPLLERLYDNAPQRDADLEQLQMAAARYETRERFLTELTLDPPQASSDLAGDPHLDDDYLILSTVHSAKGQEWDNVFVLNVTDGNFPSEFATGSEEQIDEERRLLYVASTRAKRALHYCVPFRFRVTQQARYGDKHVYGARSRFFDENVMASLESRYHQTNTKDQTQLRPKSDTPIDVNARLNDLW